MKKKIALLSYRALHDQCDCKIGFDSFDGIDVFTADYVYMRHEPGHRDDALCRKNVKIKNALLRLLHLSLKEKIAAYREVYIYLGPGPTCPETFTWEIYSILATLYNNKVKARIVYYLPADAKDGNFFKEELSDRYSTYRALDLKWIDLPGKNIEKELLSIIDGLKQKTKK